MVNVSSTSDELNILSGVSVTSTEVDLLGGAEAGKVKNGKTAVYSSSGELKASNVSTTTLDVDTSADIGNVSISNGAISDSGGTISFSDNNLTTTGNITGNNLSFVLREPDKYCSCPTWSRRSFGCGA